MLDAKSKILCALMCTFNYVHDFNFLKIDCSANSMVGSDAAFTDFLKETVTKIFLLITLFISRH